MYNKAESEITLLIQNEEKFMYAMWRNVKTVYILNISTVFFYCIKLTEFEEEEEEKKKKREINNFWHIWDIKYSWKTIKIAKM